MAEEIFNKILSRDISSSTIINWIRFNTVPDGVSCKKEEFISHILSWIHEHVKHTSICHPHVRGSNGGGGGSHNGDKSNHAGSRHKYTPHKKRCPDKKRNSYGSSSQSTHSPTYHKPNKKNSTASPLTPSKNNMQTPPITPSKSTSGQGRSITPNKGHCSLSPGTPSDYLSDYPPLSSSTPNQDGLVQDSKSEKLLAIKKRVNFSPAKEDLSNKIVPKRIPLQSTSLQSSEKGASLVFSSSQSEISKNEEAPLTRNTFSSSDQTAPLAIQNKLSTMETRMASTEAPKATRKKKPKRIQLLTISNHVNNGRKNDKNIQTVLHNSNSNNGISEFHSFNLSQNNNENISEESDKKPLLSTNSDDSLLSEAVNGVNLSTPIRLLTKSNKIQLKSCDDNGNADNISNRSFSGKFTNSVFCGNAESVIPLENHASSENNSINVFSSKDSNDVYTEGYTKNSSSDNIKNNFSGDGNDKHIDDAVFLRCFTKKIAINNSKDNDLMSVNSIAAIYSVLIQDNLITNIATELYVIFCFIKLNNLKKMTVISQHRIYFLNTLVTSLHDCFSRLPPQITTILNKHLNVSLSCPSNMPLFKSDVSIATVPFHQEEDTRPQFPNDRVFHVFKRIRDTFHTLLRDFEAGFRASTWKTETVLGERMKGLLNQKLQLAIFVHFSKLFVNLLLKRFKHDIVAMTTENSSEKIKKLENRMVDSSAANTSEKVRLCGPNTFPLSQDFFKTFIVISQNYTLNRHLIDQISCKIHELNNTAKRFFNDGDNNLDQSDVQEDYSWTVLSLQVLGKFLGLLWYMPYYTGQKIPPSVHLTLHNTRQNVFPLDLYEVLMEGIRGGCVTTVVPWVCDVIAMCDTITFNLPAATPTLVLVRDIFVSLPKLSIHPNNKLLLNFKLGWIMELVHQPHNLLSLSTGRTISQDTCQVQDTIDLVTPTLLQLSCPWIDALKHTLIRNSTDILTVPNASSPFRSRDTVLRSHDSNLTNTSDLRVKLQLQENFLHNQPHVVRKVCEFVSDRVQQNSILKLQADLKPEIVKRLGPKIRSWIKSHDESTLLEESFNSKLHFYLDSIIFTFCQDISGFCWEAVSPYCAVTCGEILGHLLPRNTEHSVVTTARAITVDRTLRKYQLWQETMLRVYVEEEASAITRSYIKHVVAGVSHVTSYGKETEESMLSRILDTLSDTVFTKNVDTNSDKTSEGTEVDTVGIIRDLIINKDNIQLVQEIADRTVDLLVQYITTPLLRFSVSTNSNTEVVYDLLKTLCHKKSVEIPFLRVFTGALHFLPESMDTGRFADVCVSLYSHGLLSPARLEHWFLWQHHQNPTYSTLFNTIIALISDVKRDKLCNSESNSPKIPYFLKQYSVHDFERWHEKTS